jgi:Holliday junction resolvase RusA-like endonuclease
MSVADLRSLYERETGKSWDASEGVPWLMKRYPDLNLFGKIAVLDKSAHVTLSDKISWLSQQECRLCRPVSGVSIIPLRIAPESWQSLDAVNKAAFKAAVAHRFRGSPNVDAYQGRICLSFVFVCSAKRRARDLDNMVKLVMDSIKGIAMGDDREVDHLSLLRVEHEGDEEYVVFRISNSNVNDHSDVVYAELRHSWAGMEPLKMEDFVSQPTVSVAG